ncbi:MAG TPA: hypothetical protein VME43_00010 [Bryobacteraceae bacterium]|nr:hypothetical protein [Bryobacteraceae bacterium]
MLRIVQIRRSSAEELTASPRYDVVEGGQLGEESGVAEISRSVSAEDVGDWLVKEGVRYSTIASVLRELAEIGSAQVALPPRVGPHIIRAWFDTILNPLIPALEFEQSLLKKRNWTFSFAPQTFDLIRPIRRYLREEAEANLDQILQLNAAVEANTDIHDAAVETLLVHVRDLHRALVASPEFADLCESLLAPEKLLEIGIQDPREIFGAYPASDRIRLIAQNVVNMTGELPPHYSTAKFWNFHREKLILSLDLPSVRDRYSDTIRSAQHLADVSATLAKLLKDLRMDLSLRYDVPPVEGDRARLTA